MTFVSPQLFPDADPPAEGEHRNRPAGPPSGCEERRTGGKIKPVEQVERGDGMWSDCEMF